MINTDCRILPPPGKVHGIDGEPRPERKEQLGVEIDTLNLGAEVEDVGKSGSFDCAAHIIVAPWPEAEPGEYEIRVRFYCTYFLGGVGEDDTDGYIQVTVAE